MTSSLVNSSSFIGSESIIIAVVLRLFVLVVVLVIHLYFFVLLLIPPTTSRDWHCCGCRRCLVLPLFGCGCRLRRCSWRTAAEILRCAARRVWACIRWRAARCSASSCGDRPRRGGCDDDITIVSSYCNCCGQWHRNLLLLLLHPPHRRSSRHPPRGSLDDWP